MTLGAKNRQLQTAEGCTQHLREKHPDKLGLVEEFIAEIEVAGKSQDITSWSGFTDIKHVKDEKFTCLDAEFEKWLNP